MNYSIIKRTLGWLLVFEGIFLLVPLLTAAIYWEEEFFTFLLCMLLSVGVGGLFFLKKSKNTAIYAKEGFVIVAMSWIVISLVGALPFFLSGAIPSYIDALFETVSGFTTTGSTILSGEQVDGMAKSLLMWRSFTHWVGGMGVLVLIMAFLPLSGAQNMYLMKAESTGASVSKIVPKVRQTAVILYAIYLGLTVLQFILLICGNMPVFDALNTAFATAGTGGFAIKSDGFLSYSPYLQWVTTAFMLVFSINFNAYYLTLQGKFKDAFTAEIKTFLIIVLSAITLIVFNLHFTQTDLYALTLEEEIRHSAFAVASIISTTGFGTIDFNLWPTLSKVVLVTLMFIGACAGSTGGGMKVSRIMVLAKGGMHEVGRMIHPKQVKKICIDGRVVEHEVVRSINAYLVAFIIIYVASLAVVSLDGFDFTTSFTAVAATINNIGPGLGMVGPTGNFADFSILSKLVFIFDMLAGRLEVFPMLILFSPATWRK